MDTKLVTRETDNLEVLDSLGSFATIENSRCPNHYDLPIQYFCMTCKRHCFCSECALTNHQNCEVMTLKQAFQSIVNNYLNKWISQLYTKSENLQVGFRQVLTDKKESWALKLQDLQYNSNRTNQVVFDNLNQVNNTVKSFLKTNNEKLQEQYKSYKKEVEDVLSEYEQVSKGLREQRKSSPTELLRFYNKNYKVLRQYLLGQVNQNYLNNADNNNNDNNSNESDANNDYLEEFERDVEYFVKNTPKQLKSQITHSEKKFKEVIHVLNNFQYNIRT